jgi:hypothetical protein
MEGTMFKDLFSLKGRIALVTGGSRGIGKMITAGFLSQGAAKVYITARKAGPCEATAKELTAEYDGECIALPIDISTWLASRCWRPKSGSAKRSSIFSSTMPASRGARISTSFPRAAGTR